MTPDTEAAVKENEGEPMKANTQREKSPELVEKDGRRYYKFDDGSCICAMPGDNINPDIPGVTGICNLPAKHAGGMTCHIRQVHQKLFSNPTGVLGKTPKNAKPQKTSKPAKGKVPKKEKIMKGVKKGDLVEVPIPQNSDKSDGPKADRNEGAVLLILAGFIDGAEVTEKMITKELGFSSGSILCRLRVSGDVVAKKKVGKGGVLYYFLTAPGRERKKKYHPKYDHATLKELETQAQDQEKVPKKVQEPETAPRVDTEALIQEGYNKAREKTLGIIEEEAKAKFWEGDAAQAEYLKNLHAKINKE